MRAHLAVKSDDEAQWAVTLCVERACGAWHNLCEGVARGAGDVTVELGDVCADVAAGERLVLLVAASCYPRWPRPPGRASQALGPGSALELSTTR